MPTRSDFNLSIDKPNLSPAASGIFTYGLDAIHLSEADVRRFNELARSLNEAAPSLSADQLTAVARRVLRKADARCRTPFIESRLRHLAEIRAMAADPAWPCEPVADRRISDLLAYIDSPHGLFRDETPVIGHLDDALLVDIAMGSLRNELEQYAEFCRYRRTMALGLGVELAAVPLGRAAWERQRGEIDQLQKQLRHVHESSYAARPTEPPFRVT